MTIPETNAAFAAGDDLKGRITAILDDAKAQDLVVIDLAGKSDVADYMVVASGTSHRHVTTMAEHVAQDLKDAGYGSAPMEGLDKGEWVLLDAGDVILHLFQPEVRAFYNLEKMWRSAEEQAERALNEA